MAMHVQCDPPPLKFLDDCIRFPSAKDGIFGELLPTEAVRRAAGNSALYGVVYRRPKNKVKGQPADVSGPLVVTVYQSDVRAKRFHTLVKMTVSVRLGKDESYRYGVAVAVDEVAECVYVAYTRDEPKPSARRRRLLLRQVKLTLAAADARGVRRLQRPSTGRPPSVTFEAKNYSKVAAVASKKKKADSRVSIQQLVLDGAALLLYWHVRSCNRGLFESAEVTPAVAQLKLRKKSASIYVRLLGPVFDNGGSYITRGVGQDKFRRKVDCKEEAVMVSLGSNACEYMDDAMNSMASPPCQPVIGQQRVPLRRWMLLGSRGRYHIFYCTFGGDKKKTIVTVCGLGGEWQPEVVGVQLVQLDRALQEWTIRHRHPTAGPVEALSTFQVRGSWLLAVAWQQSANRLVILRASLRSMMPPTKVCANCGVAHRSTSTQSNKPQVCQVCRTRQFVKYSWVLGCHFCSATCLRDAWPKHSRLHRMPSLRKWTDACWQRWLNGNPK